MKKDIFISYKDDVAGNSFAARLCSDLEKLGYAVFYNKNEHRSGSFPDDIRSAIKECRDFLLILTQSCMDQLIRYDKIDWVREEILTAYENEKNIIPLLMPGVTMPKDKESMPPELRFLPDKNAIAISEPYDKSPLDLLFSWIYSKPEQEDIHKDTYNSSPRRNIDDDIRSAQQLAQRDPKAMYQLANIFYYGLAGDESGCIRDYDATRLLLEKLSHEDSEYAKYAHSITAEMYYHGIMPREGQSYAKALHYHEKVADVSGFSAREAAYLRSRGCGCEFDYNEIVDQYKEAISSGDAVAIAGLAKFYMNYGKFTEAAELYRKTSAVLPDSKFRLGMLYREGVLEDPPKPDFFKAAFYFQHAISSGECSSEVYHQLGRLYFTPTGDFPKDFKEAEKYFKIAADMGNKGAQYKLGLMYEYGYVTQDIEKAIHYHSLSIAQGDVHSAFHLALLYQHPSVKNYQQAFHYAEIAAKKGVMEGEFLMGVFLYYGRGCTADENRAYKYLQRAYDRGMPAAKLFLDNIVAGGKAE